jgi:hypothetical protein
MLSFFAAIAALAIFIPLASANTWGKPLRFRADGTFKIVEVSDVHHTGNLFCKDISAAQQKYPCSDANGTAFFQQAILDEDPDVFVFTGDNVCSGDIFGGKNALDGLLADFVKASNTVPWLAVEGCVLPLRPPWRWLVSAAAGDANEERRHRPPFLPRSNHDGESGLNYKEVADHLLTLPNGLNEPNPMQVNGSGVPIFGNTNFWLGVYGPAGTNDENASLFNLYNVDSNSYSTDPKIPGYGWVHTDQIAWFSAVSANLTAAAAAQGRPQAPALAYQHIPLPQHQTIITDKLPIVGQYHETVCCPEIDTGLHAAFKAAGDVKALTVGHDHTNDYCGSFEGSVSADLPSPNLS